MKIIDDKGDLILRTKDILMIKDKFINSKLCILDNKKNIISKTLISLESDEKRFYYEGKICMEFHEKGEACLAIFTPENDDYPKILCSIGSVSSFDMVVTKNFFHKGEELNMCNISLYFSLLHG